MGSSAAAGHVLGAGVAQGSQIESAQQVLALPEHDGRNGEVKLVDEASLEILPTCEPRHSSVSELHLQHP